MLLDLIALLLPLLVPFAAGLPIVWLLRGRRPLGAADWLLAPFLGLGALVLVLQNLVYLDVPVARSTPWVWLLILAAWSVWLRHPSFGPGRRTWPRGPLVVALLVWVLQAAALVSVGPRHWVGRLWEDQFGYTTMAQFFRDQPFSTELGGLHQRAWMFRVLRPSLGRFALPIGLKHNRIGQSVLQAFLAASLGLDAKPLFGPLIVSGAFFLALALALLAGRLGLPPPLALLAGALGGVLPAFTQLQIENFLSHALVLGVFVAWLHVLDELGAAPAPGTLASATLVLSFGLSDYCEMWAAFLALGAVVLAVHGLEQGQGLRALRSWGLVCLLSLLLNPGFVPMLFLFSQIATTEQMHTAIYPWAYTTEGLARLWLGDLGRGTSGPLRTALADGFGLAASALGVLGLALLLRRAPSRPSRALALGVLALALGALPLRLTGQHPYQFYKTLLTGAPALVLGLVALAWLLPRPAWRRAAQAVAWAALVAALVATLDMVVPTALARPSLRSNAALMLDPEMRALMERLGQLQGQALVIGPGQIPLVNAWLTYAARGAPVWLATPRLGRDRLRESPEARVLIDLTQAPPDALVLASRSAGPFPPPGAREVWSNDAYTLWQPMAGAWAVLFDCEGRAPGEFGVSQQGTTLRLLAGSDGPVRLELIRRDEGPDVSVSWRLRSRGRVQTGRLELAQGTGGTLEITIQAGFDELDLESVSGTLRLAARLAPIAAAADPVSRQP